MNVVILFLITFSVVTGGFNVPKERCIEISFCGDVHPELMRGSPDYAFKQIQNRARGSDAVFCNLEAPITTYTIRTAGKCGEALAAKRDYVLRSPPGSIRYLKNAGFTVVSLANNHIMDYNARGLEDTINSLNKAKIAYCGAGEDKKRAMAPAIIEVKGVKVAFIAFSEIAPALSRATSKLPGIAAISYPPLNNDYINVCRSIKSARNRGAEIVIVSLHWGRENSTVHEEYQRVFAKKILDAGADCIIGHHPHVLRGWEMYKGRLVAYSLGNYIFASSDRNTKMLRVKFQKGILPVWSQQVEERLCVIRNCIPYDSPVKKPRVSRR